MDKSLLVILGLLAVVLAVFGLTASNMWAALVAMFLLGAIGFATAPGLQLRIMQVAGDAPTMASGANVAALNVGNAFGAWLGGMAIAAGFGFVSPLWVGAGLAVAAALVLALAIATKAQDPAPDLTAAPADTAIEPAPAEPVAAERA